MQKYRVQFTDCSVRSIVVWARNDTEAEAVVVSMDEEDRDALSKVEDSIFLVESVDEVEQ